MERRQNKPLAPNRAGGVFGSVEKPSPNRLSFLAFKVLEDAAVEARLAPIKPAVAHRLALAWLAYVGISEPWRTELFWKVLGDNSHTGPHALMMRERDLARCLNGWRRLIGLPPKVEFWR